MRFVSLLTPIHFRSPEDYIVNRARRGSLPTLLTLQMTGALCVGDDSGEDSDRAREVAKLLYSLKAGGLLETTMHDGQECVSPAELSKVSDRLVVAGFFGEGAQIWSGSLAVAADEALPTPRLKIALIGTAGRVLNKKGSAVSWDDFIRLSDFQDAARVGKGDKSLLWNERSARAFADSSGYVFEHVTAKPIPVPKTKPGAIEQMTGRLTRR